MSHLRSSLKDLLLLVSVVSCYSPTVVFAQSSPDEQATKNSVTGVLEEIIVTAERRATRIQETPLAIAALLGEELDRQPLTDMVQLGLRRSELTMTVRNGILLTSIRGVGGEENSLGADPRVAFYTDDVYIARGAAQVAGVFDVERVEIVQGPQGTLFGRNATGGAISVITRAPTDSFSGYVNQSIGNYDFLKTNAAINVPANDVLSFRLATEVIDRSGFGHDVYLHEDVDDHSSKALRGRAQLDFDSFSFDLIADYSERDDNGFPFEYGGFLSSALTQVPPPFINSDTVVPGGDREISADQISVFNNESKGLTLIGKFDLSENVSLKSITGYRANDYKHFVDVDGTNVRAMKVGSFEDSTTFSQEFQLNGQYGRSNLTLGVYGFDEDLTGSVRFAVTDVFPVLGAILAATDRSVPPGEYFGLSNVEGRQDTRAYAVFGQLTHDFTDELSVIVGARYTWEEKSVVRGGEAALLPGVPIRLFTTFEDYTLPESAFTPEVSESWDKLTPRLSLQYEFSPQVMGYLTYAQGFKSGAYSLAAQGNPVDPEILDDLEGGLKTTLFDGRFRADFSAFYYDYQDLQVQRSTGIVLELENAAEATVYGAGVDLTGQITDRLLFSMNALFMHSEYDEFTTADSTRPELGVIDLAGDQLTRAPDYKISLAADYTVPVGDGEMTFHAQSTSIDKYYLTIFNIDELSSPSSTVIDAWLEYRWSGLKVSLWANNITDEKLPIQKSATAPVFGNNITVAYSAPRTYGVTIGYEW